MKNQIIETDRLLLRPFEDSDFEDVYEFNSNLEVHKYTGDEIITSLDRAKEIIKEIWHKDYNKYGYGRLATIYKPDNKLIGFTGLKYMPEIGETDIGYRYLPAYWGKGIATEASKAVLKYGFETLNLERIIGIAFPENIPSCKVLEKIGLSLYKVGDFDGDGGTYNWYEIEKEAYHLKKQHQP